MKVLIIGAGGMADGIVDVLDNNGYEYKVVDKDFCDVRQSSKVYYSINKFKPQIVICTAGISHVATVKDSDTAQWADEIFTNLIGSYHVAKHAVDAGVKTMIFIASVAGLYGKPEHSGYSASKAGLISLVQSLGMEGYDAYAISPGRVNTPMREHDYPNDTPGSRLEPEQIGEVVIEILKGVHSPGDNIIIRKKGLEKIIRQTDDGEPWKDRLEVGKPVTI
jgi:NAD(P)-dependent dehydrogenase (short-subunit alcohol dehydrogenase family)